MQAFCPVFSLIRKDKQEQRRRHQMIVCMDSAPGSNDTRGGTQCRGEQENTRSELSTRHHLLNRCGCQFLLGPLCTEEAYTGEGWELQLRIKGWGFKAHGAQVGA